jgi:hypothetical protein
VQEAAPPRLIEVGIPTEAMVAHVAVARFADHQPLYRQAQIMTRQGVMLDRSTLASWMGYAAAEVAPVVARLREIVLASGRIFADETIVPVLDQDAVAPNKATSGPLRAMIAAGVAAIRLLWSTSMHLAVDIITPRLCWVITAASCNVTGINPTRCWRCRLATHLLL